MPPSKTTIADFDSQNRTKSRLRFDFYQTRDGPLWDLAVAADVLVENSATGCGDHGKDPERLRQANRIGDRGSISGSDRRPLPRMPGWTGGQGMSGDVGHGPTRSDRGGPRDGTYAGCSPPWGSWSWPVVRQRGGAQVGTSCWSRVGESAFQGRTISAGRPGARATTNCASVWGVPPRTSGDRAVETKAMEDLDGSSATRAGATRVRLGGPLEHVRRSPRD